MNSFSLVTMNEVIDRVHVQWSPEYGVVIIRLRPGSAAIHLSAELAVELSAEIAKAMTSAAVEAERVPV